MECLGYGRGGADSGGCLRNERLYSMKHGVWAGKSAVWVYQEGVGMGCIVWMAGVWVLKVTNINHVMIFYVYLFFSAVKARDGDSLDIGLRLATGGLSLRAELISLACGMGTR